MLSDHSRFWFHVHDAVLHIRSRRGGVKRIFAMPVTAEQLDLSQCPPAWISWEPAIRFHRLLRAAEKSNDATRHPFDFGRGLQLPSDGDSEKSLAVSGFLNAIGADLCATVAKFRSCQEQCALLKQLQIAPTILSLQKNPPLLFAAITEARRWAADCDVGVLLDRMAAMPLRDLARSFGFPNDLFLRRVRASEVTTGLLDALRDICRDRNTQRFLSHQYCITADVVALLHNRPIAEHLDYRFLKQLLRRDDILPLPSAGQVAGLVDFLRLAGRRTFRISSLKQFWRLRSCNPALEFIFDVRRLASMTFGEPPIPDEPGFITALRTGPELIRESFEMHHCAAGRCALVLNRRAYYYRIDGTWGMPRGTMEIVPAGGHWRISQIVAPCNKRFPEAYIRHAALWLAERQHVYDETLVYPRSWRSKSHKSPVLHFRV